MKHRNAILVFLAACPTACGALAGLGDAPTVAADGGVGSSGDGGVGVSTDGQVTVDSPIAISESGAEAETESSVSVDADGDAAWSAGPPTSCLEVLEALPGSPSGIYSLVANDGGTFDAYCEMTLAGGGWTAFFADRLGSANVFARFEPDPVIGVTDDCTAPDTHCLRHTPASVTTANAFAATCADAAVLLSVSPYIIDYFQTGKSAYWLDFTGFDAGTTGTNANTAAFLWSGDTMTNQGWILSTNDNAGNPTSNTFASSYDSRNDGGWDYCNGVDYNGAAAGSMPFVRLFYR